MQTPQGRKVDEVTHKGTGLTWVVKLESGRGLAAGAPRWFFAEVEGTLYTDATFEGLVGQVHAALDGMLTQWVAAIYVNTTATEGFSSDHGPDLYGDKQYLGLGVRRYWVRARRDGLVCYAPWDSYDPTTGRDERNHKPGVLDKYHWSTRGYGIDTLTLPYAHDHTNAKGGQVYGSYIWLPYDETLYHTLVAMQAQVAAIAQHLAKLLRVDNGLALVGAAPHVFLAPPDDKGDEKNEDGEADHDPQ